MEKCRYYEMAHLYPYGMLEPEEEKEFLAHVEGCRECAAVAAEVSEIKKISDMAADAGAPAGLEARLKESLKQKAGEAPARVYRPAFGAQAARLMPVAACLAILLFAAVLFTPPNVAGDSAGSGAASGEIQLSSLYLGDGTDEVDTYIIAGDKDTALVNYYGMIAEEN